MGIDVILNGPNPTEAFKFLKNQSRQTRKDKLKLLGDLIKTWEFFSKEKKAGRLHYKPLDPEDTKGLTQTIEVGEMVPGTYGIQFSGSSLENSFVVKFQESDVPKKLVEKKMKSVIKHSEVFYLKQSKEKLRSGNKSHGLSI